MKTVIISLLFLFQNYLPGNTQQETPTAVKEFIPAETVAWNTTSTGFTVTFYRIADNQTYVKTMGPGYDNIDNKWQMVAGVYNVTFTPFTGTSYGSTTFAVNGKNTVRLNSNNTAPVTISNVELYEGGGNQVNIEPY